MDHLGTGLWIANILGALAIAYLFTAMVIAATAQQDAIVQMKAEKISQGYSPAFAIANRANELDEAALGRIQLSGERMNERPILMPVAPKQTIRFRPIVA